MLLVDRMSGKLLLASTATALVGIWNLGVQISTRGAAMEAWQFKLFAGFGLRMEAGVFESFLIGLVFFAPVLLVCLAVSRCWAEIFARWRGRPLDHGWLICAWCFALLLPATMPLYLVAVGLSFGLVFGCHVFGGTGRYIVNPALLGIVFLGTAYPGFLAETRWLPGIDTPTAWAAVGASAFASGEPPSSDWWMHFSGMEIGAFGSTSALACLFGAALLIARRAASADIVLGGLLGLAVAGAAVGTLPWHWHLALGQFAFGLAFVATDPSIQPASRRARWLYGLLFGTLTVVLRAANPEHPEGTAFALLLASLCVPLLDHLVAPHAARSPKAVGDDATT